MCDVLKAAGAAAGSLPCQSDIAARDYPGLSGSGAEADEVGEAMTQGERILEVLAAHRGEWVESEVLYADYIRNPATRVSELRAKGHAIEVRHRPRVRDGRTAYVGSDFRLG